ncbi:hypothetical protein A33M_0703 [Rhodovulum sp. PH10]|nr:hypothetical protein A33M_0703 [Rhodovulum sp. PH10]
MHHAPGCTIFRGPRLGDTRWSHDGSPRSRRRSSATLP